MKKEYILFSLLLLFCVFNVNSQCENISSETDKFTKATTSRTKNSLKIKKSIFAATISLNSTGTDLSFYVSLTISSINESETKYHFGKMIILFTDGTTATIGDEFEQLNLNKGIAKDQKIIDILKSKKVESIRIIESEILGSSHYDFNLTIDQQSYFIENVKCLFP